MKSADKIVNISEAIRLREEWKSAGQKVVFSNGCFDLLHEGHISYLEASKAKGDKLIIGLNTDASVARLKGPSRPIVPEMARARVLAALEAVDAVVLFDEATPLALIEALSPDILTKGKDYQVEQIVGSHQVIAKGGRVETVDLVDGFSTTAIITRILSGSGDRD
jgi:D-glycero-beta-D-manno-heptose 1-phosphate adenylyltransferase